MNSPTNEPPIKKKKRRRKLPRGLVLAEEAAEICRMGRSTWDAKTAAGLTPAPDKLEGRPLWGVRELLAWIDHQCPERAVWQVIWKQLRDRRK